MKKLLAILALSIAALPCFAQYVNTPIVLLPSAAYTATTITSPDQQNLGYRGVTVYINVTGLVSGQYTVTIQGKDTYSGQYYTILASAAITNTGFTTMVVYPEIPASTNAIAQAFLPAVWRVSLAGASTPNLTFSVSASLQL